MILYLQSIPSLTPDNEQVIDDPHKEYQKQHVDMLQIQFELSYDNPHQTMLKK